MYLICGRKKNMKNEKYEKGRSVNQRSGSTEKAGRRRENDAKSQELLSGGDIMSVDPKPHLND